ncbi:MAG: hypothetical protein ACKPKO_02255, partial [Candidatus Fonsibacter sp.]
MGSVSLTAASCYVAQRIARRAKTKKIAADVIVIANLLAHTPLDGFIVDFNENDFNDNLFRLNDWATNEDELVAAALVDLDDGN